MTARSASSQVLSAKQMGAGRIIAMSRHESRQKLAREFGATDIVTERGGEGVARIDGDSDGEKEGFMPVVLCEAIDEENQRHHHHHEPDHQPSELLHAFVEASLYLLADNAARHAPEVSLRACCEHDRCRRAALHARAKEADIGELQRGDILPRLARIDFSTGRDSPVSVA